MPTHGTNSFAGAHYTFDGPDITPPLPTGRSSAHLFQVSGETTHFWSPDDRSRLFVLAGAGTSFNDEPLPTDQYVMGSPFHLGAQDFGEFRGDHYYVASGGYARQLGRLPDFMGGGVFAAAWLENGDAFNGSDAKFRTNASTGLIMDTIVGPVILATSFGFDGAWRTYIGVGRIFGRARAN
jgi:NTE family protein